MDLITGAQKAELASSVDFFNKQIGNRAARGSNLNRDDFLKILITQLQNQDPTAPLEDKEFVAQMAQFSTLEQMTNLSGDFRNLMTVMEYSRVLEVLGKDVQINSNDTIVEGRVTAVRNDTVPQVEVNGNLYDFASILRVQEVATP